MDKGDEDIRDVMVKKLQRFNKKQAEYIDEKDKEIKRLRKDGRCIVEAKEVYHKNWIDAKNENERLRESQLTSADIAMIDVWYTRVINLGRATDEDDEVRYKLRSIQQTLKE